MTTTTPVQAPAPRPTLDQLAQQDPEQLLTGLRNALPDNPHTSPSVSAFQSSI
jgi:cytochrome c-type biogenesis protein CcmH/NrfG